MKLFLSLIISVISLSVWSHGDDDHSHEQAPTLLANAAPRIELTSENVEVVAMLKEQRLQLYVDNWSTNEPIDNASVTVQWNDQTLETVRVDNGVYRSGVVPESAAGQVALVVTVLTDDNAELLNGQWTLPEVHEEEKHWHAPSWLYSVLLAVIALVVGWWFGKRRAVVVPVLVLALMNPPRVDAHGDDTHGAEEPVQSKLINADEKAARLADGSLFVPKTVQRLLSIRTQPADFSKSAFSAKLPAEVSVDPKSGGAVQAPVPGRVSAVKGRWPTPGQTVKKGQALLLLQWQLSATEQAQTTAQLARIETQLRVAEARWSRIQSLTETLPRKELEQAQADVDALRAERTALNNSISKPQVLRASSDGVISQINVRDGEQVNAGAHLLTVVSGELTVTALAPSDFVALSNANAVFISANRRVNLTLIGQARELKDQQRPLLFQITEGSAQFAIGDSGQVLIETELLQNGVKVPAEAIVRAEDGSKAVMVKRSAEIFRLQTVHVQTLNGGEVLLLSGVRGGERVVTSGAPLLAQLR